MFRLPFTRVIHHSSELSIIISRKQEAGCGRRKVLSRDATYIQMFVAAMPRQETELKNQQRNAKSKPYEIQNDRIVGGNRSPGRYHLVGGRNPRQH
jgi:hypothetical protein